MASHRSSIVGMTLTVSWCAALVTFVLSEHVVAQFSSPIDLIVYNKNKILGHSCMFWISCTFNSLLVTHRVVCHLSEPSCASRKYVLRKGVVAWTV
jgi:hypothetical protein